MKKVLSLFLVAIMVLSAFTMGMTVLAEEASGYDAEVLDANGTFVKNLNLSELTENSGPCEPLQNCTIKLLRDVTTGATIHLWGNITVDGNGHTVSYPNGRVFQTATDLAKRGNGDVAMSDFKTVTFKNLKVEGKEIVATYNGAVRLEAGNEFTSTGAMFLTARIDGAVFDVFDGIYTATGNSGVAMVFSCNDWDQKCVFNVYGGKFVCGAGTTANIAYFKKDCTLNIYDGEFIGADHVIINMVGKDGNVDKNILVNVYGGYFHSEKANRIMVVLYGTMNMYGGLIRSINRGEGDLFTVRNDAKLNIYGGSIINYPGKDPIQIKDKATVKYPVGAKENPQMKSGASVRLVEGEIGIRFESTFSANQIALIESIADQGSIQFGTIVAPSASSFIKTHVAEYKDGSNVVTARIEATDFDMNMLKALGLQEGRDYVNIVAEKGISRDGEGNVTIHSALTNFTEDQVSVNLSAISYIRYEKDGHEVYICSTYDPVNNSRSMQTVAQRALDDVQATADGVYHCEVVGGYSPYTPGQRDALAQYLPK